MNRQNHSEPENRLTLEEQQEFLKLLARLSPEQREGLSQILCKVQTAIKQEQFEYEAADGKTGCRLNNNITPARGNVKGGEAVHIPLTFLRSGC